MKIIDPIKFVSLCWPHITLYDKQVEILYSVRDNDETFVPAGNGLGKDFISAICALWFFVSRRPARVVTTSVQHNQLNDVLWGEIRRLLRDSAVSLPIKYNHMHIRQVDAAGEYIPLCEIVGQVVAKGEALLGRHLPRTGGVPRTLCIFDEASGMPDDPYNSSDTWAHRKLIIGNPYPCSNFFYRGVKRGDVERSSGGGLYSSVIKIQAEDSPNIKYAREEIARGTQPSGRELIPGVLDWNTYQKRRKLWDKIKQSIGLDAEFWEGEELFMFPKDSLDRSATLPRQQTAQAIGIDAAEGGDSTVWAVVNDRGVVDLCALKTPDTSIIYSHTLTLMGKHGVQAENVMFDRGGGGKQHADYLRANGHDVQTVGFGEAATPHADSYLMRFDAERRAEKENRYAYKNRRAEMYGMIRDRLMSTDGFSIGDDTESLKELRRQMRPIPLQYDPDGRIYLPPKKAKSAKSREITLIDIIGHSPDELDALACAVYALSKIKSMIYI